MQRTNSSRTVRFTMCDIDMPPSADSSLISRNCSESMSQLGGTITLDKVNNDLLLNNEFARQEFNRKRKIIIRNTPVVTYAVSLMF